MVEQPATQQAEEAKWVTTNSAPMDPEEEANLAAFLTKIQAACQKDSDVPGFVGSQVNEWLAEIA